MADESMSAGQNGPFQVSGQYVLAYRFQFFVPRHYNPDATGRRESIPQEKFDQLQERLAQRFPGLTASKARPPLGQGIWLGASRHVFTDECYLYDVIVEPNEDDRAYFRQLLSEFLDVPDNASLGFDQEAVLLVLTQVEQLYLQREASHPSS